MAEKAVSVGPLMFRRFSSHAKIMVSAFLMATQLGICSVYALFVAVNLKAVYVLIIYLIQIMQKLGYFSFTRLILKIKFQH